MVKRWNRLLIAFLLAYVLRFETGLIPVTKGYPPFSQYVNVLPFIGILVPLAYHMQGIYRLRRGRSRVDDFFAVFVGSILSVCLGIGATLYVQVYYVPELDKDKGIYEISQLVWAMFLVLNVGLTYASRELVREALERRWKAGIGLKRVLIAGAGELGRIVADKVLEHRELGYKVVGFVDDRAGGDHLGYRGLPLLGTLCEASEILQRERIDQLYIALALDEHVKMVSLVESANREIVDIKVVPDLVQVIALRARLEELDGIPIINIHDVPLKGLNSAPRCSCSPPSSPRLPRSCGSPPRGRPSSARSAWASTASASSSGSSDRCTMAPSARPGRCGRAKTIRAARRWAACSAASASMRFLSSGTC